MEVDVPAVFKVKKLDNTCDPKIDDFSIIPQGGISGSEIAQTTSAEIKTMFRKSGDYLVKLKVEDNALDWPSDYKNPVTTANNKHNVRILHLMLHVHPTKLDIRVIERKRNGM